ncbi:MAG: hypothetical protein GWP10_06495 [Nitrospiraceae bacterium]|nr:hypothetical protein [Nitrospiraceae bacterium]
MPIYEKIRSLYPDGEIPEKHTYKIREYLEEKIKNYKTTEEEIEQALALIKPEGFNKEERDGKVIYTTEIIYHKGKAEKLFAYYKDFKNLNKKGFGFHYTPYNFDSKPEKDFFTNLLIKLNENPDDVEDIYFTGALTDTNKTDFFFEYYDKEDKKWHTYTPDFLIRKKNGKILIVEIKAEEFRENRINGEKRDDEGKIEKEGLKAGAVRKIEGLNPDKLRYEILFTNGDEIGFNNLQKVEKIIYKD